MSLGVYLRGDVVEVACVCSACGHKHAAQEAEMHYSANITHNLASMAEQAGIYKHLWRPDEVGITRAADLVEPLKAGLATLRREPWRFRPLSPTNGWGSYDGLVVFVRLYIAACEEYPNARVEVSR